jgi:hypothetical protein
MGSARVNGTGIGSSDVELKWRMLTMGNSGFRNAQLDQATARSFRMNYVVIEAPDCASLAKRLQCGADLSYDRVPAVCCDFGIMDGKYQAAPAAQLPKSNSVHEWNNQPLEMDYLRMLCLCQRHQSSKPVSMF